jgi:long-subunit acyl-CoA synthetase (AMP-forming)
MLAPGAFPSVRYSIFCGQPFGKMDAAIVDSSLQFLPPGEKGELALCGEQVAKGYFT